MRTLALNEIENVNGALSADGTAGLNLGIVAIGVGVLAAGATAPIWFPIAMIGVSIASVVTMTE